MASPSSPTRFVFVALLLTLCLSALLGFNALVTARYHRSVAERVLRDYAGFAAAELESRVQTAVARGIFPILSEIGARAAKVHGGPLPRPPGVETVFRLAPGEALETRGTTLEPEAGSLLADSLAGHARSVLTPPAYLALLWLPGGRVAALASDRVVYGAILPDSLLSEFVAPAITRAPLLPPSLTGGTRLDSAVAYRIMRPDGSPLLGSAIPAGPFSARRLFDAQWGGLAVEVALRRELAPALVVGGVPRSRVPLVLGLLALSTLLVGTAVVQLRRERELGRLREEFVAAASHELRTPLAQIRLFSETLRLGRVRSEAERDHSLDIIQQETLRLSHLVENILYVGRSSRGALAIAPRELDLARELRVIVDGFTPLAAARNVTLATDIPPRVQARADEDAFRQMVLNLLDNAVKYGPPGQTVTARLSVADGKVRLAVEDQGPGVPPADRARIFERFVRLEGAVRAGTAGTGLGLALVQELARLHGGAARVEPAGQGGSRFIVEW